MAKVVKKSEQIAAMILERIRYGCYHTGVLPSLRELAAELGVNYLTVRQGLHLLCDQGVIGTTRNRKFSILTQQPTGPGMRIALVEGAGGHNIFMRALNLAMQRRQGSVRRFIYSYSNDELLTMVPDMNFDLVFFHVTPEDMPPMVLSKFITCRERLVSFSHDYTEYGIRSILEPELEHSITMLFDLLREHGHQRFDVVAPQGGNHVIERRIGAFQKAAEEAGRVCNTHRYQVVDYLFDMNTVREAARAAFSGRQAPEAVFVPTAPHAVGVMRGLLDLGWLAGRDYSLVSSGDRDVAVNAIPSITICTTENFSEVLEEVLNGSPEQKMKFFLEDHQLILGESLIRK